MYGEVLSDSQFATLAKESGATRHIRTLKSVSGSGYAVGGAGIKEVKIPVDKFSHRDVGEHLAVLHKRFGDDPSIHQGAWRENADVVLDASSVYKSRSHAINVGIRRRERAIYDVAKNKDINLPTLNKVEFR